MEGTEKPVVLEQSVTDRSAGLRLHIPGGLKCFEGHFPKAPLVPGIVQLHWAIVFARDLFSMKAQISGIEVLKFQKAMQPESTPLLSLRYLADSGKLLFDYSADDDHFSSGRIILS